MPHPDRNAPKWPLDPARLEGAALAAEFFLHQRQHAGARFEGEGPGGNDARRSAEALTAAVELLVTGHRHHRPTQRAYNRACDALREQHARTDAAESHTAGLETQLAQARDRIAELDAELRTIRPLQGSAAPIQTGAQATTDTGKD